LKRQLAGFPRSKPSPEEDNQLYHAEGTGHG